MFVNLLYVRYLLNKVECLLDWAGKLAKDKYSSLLQKNINYGQKSFITLGQGLIVIFLVKLTPIFT